MLTLQQVQPPSHLSVFEGESGRSGVSQVSVLSIACTLNVYEAKHYAFSMHTKSMAMSGTYQQ